MLWIAFSQRYARMYDCLGGVSAAVSAARVGSTSELGAGFIDAVVYCLPKVGWSKVSPLILGVGFEDDAQAFLKNSHPTQLAITNQAEAGIRSGTRYL
jgi:hypothetical protein